MFAGGGRAGESESESKGTGNYFRTFGQQRRRPSGKKVAQRFPLLCVCVCVKNPDGPMKIIACLARFELQLRTWRMPVWARQGRARRGGSKRQDTSSKEVNVFFVYLSTATLPAALARKIAEHTRGAVDVS